MCKSSAVKNSYFKNYYKTYTSGTNRAQALACLGPGRYKVGSVAVISDRNNKKMCSKSYAI